MFCLDTNVVIAVLKRDPLPLLKRFNQELLAGNLALSTIALFELRYGIANSSRRVENTERLSVFLQAPIAVLAFDDGDAAEAGEIRSFFRQAGTPIGPYDVMIAGQARRRDLIVVTANQREFSRVPGLRTEDWLRP